MKKSIVLVALLLTFHVAATAQNNRNVLFIGNSYTEVNNLPNLVQRAAASAGRTLTYQSNTPGGCTFQQHCSNQSMTLICQGGWDAVVLQEQSQYPSFPQSQVESEVFPYAARLVDSVYAHNACANPMFYMTWGRKNGDAENATQFPILGTYEGMDSMLYVRYMYMKNTNDASVSPVGRVWRYLRTNNPDLELYASDGSHPSLIGSYAAACAFYTLLFEDTPQHITYDAGLDAATAQTIRNVVQQVVFDTLTFWQRPLPAAHFEASVADTLSPSEYTFQNTSEHADTYLWQFGDGGTSTSMNPVHNYADTGRYTVTLIASRHCMYDTTQAVVHVTSALLGIDGPAQVQVLQVYPNPILNTATLKSLQAGEVRIFDPQGHLVKIIKVEKGENILDLTSLPANLYVLRLGDSEGKVVVKL